VLVYEGQRTSRNGASKQQKGSHPMTGSVTPATPGWRKSSFSGEGNCLELTPLSDGSIALRHSQVSSQEITVFTKAEMEAFFRGIKAGEFDDLIS
jgi:hypothetical protein